MRGSLSVKPARQVLVAGTPAHTDAGRARFLTVGLGVRAPKRTRTHSAAAGSRWMLSVLSGPAMSAFRHSAQFPAARALCACSDQWNQREEQKLLGR
ncbi:hypothetical protein NDU88_001130 [Pleurodeles waltl]|uniref:Uncharacterized protein n=1 Tax=Pleurodeles waltl TaxID=8319 RepID=A0AAV7KS31_PLEWA|nr:hypothetical protein NDU88_001130 [Pleurodeles waltl]